MNCIGHKTSGNQSPAIGDININELKSQIKKELTDEIKKQCDGLSRKVGKSKSKYSYIKLLLWITLFAILFFGLAICLNNRFKFGLSDDSIVITFVGILATFIVVSNFMQVQKIKDELQKKFDEKIHHEECKFSAFIHYQRAISAKRNIIDYSGDDATTKTNIQINNIYKIVDAFDGYIYSIASWSEDISQDQDYNLLDKAIEDMMEIKEKGETKSIAEQYEKNIDENMIKDCMQVLYTKTKNKNRHIVAMFINEIAEKINKS
jgi:hypothetical protein